MNEPIEFSIINTNITPSTTRVSPSDLRTETETEIHLDASTSTRSILGGHIVPSEIPLGNDNVGIASSEANIDSFINVQVDMLQRLYSGMYIMSQTFYHIYGDEKLAMCKVALDENLFAPLIRVYPQLEDFEYHLELDDDCQIVVIGENTFAKTLLHAIQQSLDAPISDTEPTILS